MSDDNLQLAYQRLLALERFKSGFLARTSHELRSPINTIVSLSQLILEDLCEGPEEEKEFTAQSKAAALKMLALFDQIAAVSKLDVGREPPKIETVDLSFLLPEVEMLTALQAANQNVRYRVDEIADELEIRADAKWLKHILTSLIQDAVAHTKVMRLGTEAHEGKVAVFVESDRPAQALQSELEQVAEFLEAPSEPLAPKHSDKYSAEDFAENIENMQLSTGLVLAMAKTAASAIGGEFIIDAVEGDRSRLQCVFASAQTLI